MNEQIYTNYRLLLPLQELLGTIVVREGLIADIQPGVVRLGQDGGGDYLLPGLIELHTDNLESCMSPRPGVHWNREAAAIYNDRDLAAAGITTACNAIAVGDVNLNSPRLNQFAPMIDVVCSSSTMGRFSIEHRLHLRCELSYEHAYDITEKYADNPLLCLVSLMDHTPGQRQFVDIDKFKEYYMGKHGVGTTEIEDFIKFRQQQQQIYAQKNRSCLVKLAQTKGIFLASHDDATIEHVKEAVEDGVTITEFPTTTEAAQEARTRGLQILMGAPNLVLGKSHSGNVSAVELAELDLVDIISCDYAPYSLLQSIFIVAKKTGKPLYETSKLVTNNPAKAIKLDHDRGSLEIGKRADLITVHDDGVVPRLTSVICKGRRIA